MVTLTIIPKLIMLVLIQKYVLYELSMETLGEHLLIIYLKKYGCPKCANSRHSKLSLEFLNELAQEFKVDRYTHAENKGKYVIHDNAMKCRYYCDCDGMFEERRST